MNKRFFLDTLQPADRLVIPKNGFVPIQHHAIYIGEDNIGNRLYIENTIGKGVQVVPEGYLFRDGYELTRVEQFVGNQHQRNLAVQFAKQLIGKQYDLLNFNCEHYANSVQHRKNYSSQVEKGIVLSMILLILGIRLSK